MTTNLMLELKGALLMNAILNQSSAPKAFEAGFFKTTAPSDILCVEDDETSRNPPVLPVAVAKNLPKKLPHDRSRLPAPNFMEASHPSGSMKASHSVIHVLAVEDDPACYALIRKYLVKDGRSRFDLTHVENLTDALEKLHQENFDAVLLDLSLSDSRGEETFDRVYRVASETPIIPFTALDDPNLEMRLIRYGAQDFVRKSELAEGLKLGDTIRHAVERNKLRQIIENRSALLENALADLESFSYTVIHDLRAPLRSVSGFAEALRADCGAELNQNAQGYLDRITTAATRMDNLILDVLSYTRTAQPVKMETVDLGKIIEDVFQGYPGVSVPHAEFFIERPLPKVRGNYALMIQCISNLLENAVKFVGARKKVKVRIWTEKTDSRVKLKIQDNGIGIPAEFLRKIFEPFQRLYPQAGYGGSGIGLAIVKKAAEKMGGKISVESQPGKGSTFTIELPAAEALRQLPAIGRIVPPVSTFEEGFSLAPAPDKSSDENPLILLVEDDENDQLFLERALRKDKMRHRLQWAKDGLEAADYLETNGQFADRSKYPLPDIILMDLKMPRMNGFELLALLKKHPEMRNIPRIVLTSSDFIDDRTKAYELGATRCLMKPTNPFDLKTIVKVIRDSLDELAYPHVGQT